MRARVPADPPRPEAPAIRLPGVRALATADGEARLLVEGVETVVRPGSLLGADVVKSVAAGRIVLFRPASADPVHGDSFVIVTFDAKGESRVIVIASKDPTAHVPPEVRRP